MIEFRPVRSDEEALTRYRELFEVCFSPQPKFGIEALRWLYADNPDGQAIGYDAWEDGQLAAHYVCVPAGVLVNGLPERGLLSLNTATHPRWQGKGLFTTLASKTYESAAQSGYGSVYGVANANSTPGFVRKLGFQLVAPLQAKIGVGRLGFDPQAASAAAQFKRVWSPQALRWRCANPINPVAVRARGDGSRSFYAAGPAPLLPAYAELPGGEHSAAALAGFAAPTRLYLGLVPAVSGGLGRYVDIPRRLRPSPLNLIFKDLSGRQRLLDRTRVYFTFMDFDAY